MFVGLSGWKSVFIPLREEDTDQTPWDQQGTKNYTATYTEICCGLKDDGSPITAEEFRMKARGFLWRKKKKEFIPNQNQILFWSPCNVCWCQNAHKVWQWYYKLSFLWFSKQIILKSPILTYRVRQDKWKWFCSTAHGVKTVLYTVIYAASSLWSDWGGCGTVVRGIVL